MFVYKTIGLYVKFYVQIKNGWKYIDELFLKTTQLAFDYYEYWLMDWCLMPASAVFQLFLDGNTFFKFNKLIASTIRYKTYLCIKQSDYM